MIDRRLFMASALALGLAATPAIAEDRISVVASFSILGDLVQEVGGDRIELTTLVGPDGDPHVYQPTPADARVVAEADLVVVNGLALKGWMDRLVESTDYAGPLVVATDGIDPLDFDEDAHGHAHAHDNGGHAHNDGHGHDDGHSHEEEHGHEHDESHGHDDGHSHGEEHGHEHEESNGHDHAHHHGPHDPHVWQDARKTIIYVQNIRDGLVAADPDHAGGYETRAADYIARLEALDEELRDVLSVLPEERRKVVTTHDAFQYFGAAYGLTFLAPVGISTDAEPSAGELATLIEQIRKEGISAVFMENITDVRMIEQIAREGDAMIGGTLYSDALSGPDGPAGTYIDMMRHNARTIAEALGES